MARRLRTAYGQTLTRQVLRGEPSISDLKDVLERLPTHPASRIDESLPHCRRVSTPLH
jgi:hypothetical protein